MSYTPETAFNFLAASYTPATLFNFDAATGGNVTAVWLATTEDATGQFIGRSVVTTSVMLATTEAAIGQFVGRFDVNVQRFTTQKTASDWLDATAAHANAIQGKQQQGAKTLNVVNSAQYNASHVSDCTSLANEQADPLPAVFCGVQQQTTALQQAGELTQEQVTPVNRIGAIELTQAQAIDSVRQCAILQQMTPVRPERVNIDYDDTDHRTDDHYNVMLDPLPPDNYTTTTQFIFASGVYTPDSQYSWSFGRPDALAIAHYQGVIGHQHNARHQPTTRNALKKCAPLQNTRQPPRGQTPWIDLPRPPVNPDPPGGATYTIPVQDYYIMQNTITITLADAVTPVQLDAINIQIDADNPVWTFTGQLLDPAEIALVKPLSDGSAVTIIVTINGGSWHLLVEKIRQSRTFGRETVNISGRGLSAQLGKPYQPANSVTQGSTLTVQQLAEQLLPMGWTLNWSAPVWLVDGGAYSYANQTPLDALNELATHIGAVAIPATDSQTINMVPRYPVLPWNFNNVLPDVAMTDDVIIELSEEPTSSYQANGVYVHGGEIGGELGFCRLNGTAGDKLTDTASNQLMTDPAGLRALGERLLAGQFEQPKIKSLTTFMDGVVVPFINIGTFVGVTVDTAETRGVVNAVSIAANLAQVTQTITIGEATPNTWTAFRELLPADPLLVGTLSSTDGQTSLLTLIDGGVIRVRGTGTVSQKYYIRSGQIQGDAPNLPSHDIVI